MSPYQINRGDRLSTSTEISQIDFEDLASAVTIARRLPLLMSQAAINMAKIWPNTRKAFGGVIIGRLCLRFCVSGGHLLFDLEGLPGVCRHA